MNGIDRLASDKKVNMIGHDLHAFNDKIQFFRLFHENLLQSFVYSVHQDLPSVLWAEDYMIAQIIYAVGA